MVQHEKQLTSCVPNQPKSTLTCAAVVWWSDVVRGAGLDWRLVQLAAAPDRRGQPGRLGAARHRRVAKDVQRCHTLTPDLDSHSAVLAKKPGLGLCRLTGKLTLDVACGRRADSGGGARERVPLLLLLSLRAGGGGSTVGAQRQLVAAGARLAVAANLRCAQESQASLRQFYAEQPPECACLLVGHGAQECSWARFRMRGRRLPPSHRKNPPPHDRSGHSSAPVADWCVGVYADSLPRS